MEKEKFGSQSGIEKGLERSLENNEGSRIETLSGFETAELTSKVYDILGPELGSRLVEPNVILAISGIKGYADIAWVKLNQDEIKKFELANERLSNLGLKVVYPKRIKGDSEIRSIALENFKGVERKTRTTKIPGVITYESSSGNTGLMNWYRNINDSLKEAQKAGKISEEVDLEILFEGIILGYPDQAILDFEKCYRTGNVRKDLLPADIISTIPEAKKYPGAVPEFDYYPEHKDDPEIVEYISKARRILEEFYQSDWFKEMSQTQEFQESRQKVVQTKKEGLSERRSKK